MGEVEAAITYRDAAVVVDERELGQAVRVLSFWVGVLAGNEA